MEIEHDDADQEQDAARQRVEEELERRIDPAVAAPDADDHVHRDQHRLPEDVEQEQVERAEHPQHQRLHASRLTMNSFTLRSIATHEASTQIQPNSEVRNTKSALIPSTPSA